MLVPVAEPVPEDVVPVDDDVPACDDVDVAGAAVVTCAAVCSGTREASAVATTVPITAPATTTVVDFRTMRRPASRRAIASAVRWAGVGGVWSGVLTEAVSPSGLNVPFEAG